MFIATRSILMRDVSDTKENYDAAPLLRASKGRQDSPTIHCRRSGGNTLSPSRGRSMRRGTRHANLRNLIYHTTKQERLNGEIAGRFRSARGINEKVSLISR